MERTITTDRRYPVGDYKFITFTDTISNLPQEVALNPIFVSEARFMQLVGFEVAYRKYIQLLTQHPHAEALDKAIKALEEIRLDSLKKLNVIINGETPEDPHISEDTK